MKSLTCLEEKIYEGYLMTKEEALFYVQFPIEELCETADRVRIHFCGSGFDICTIINGKSGRCSENCKFCAQSAYYHTKIDEYSLLDSDTLVNQAVYNASRGALRYSIVTSGRSLNDSDIASLCNSIRKIKDACSIEICVSCGLLTAAQYKLLKNAGASRIHNNLEASRNFFPNICTTHTTEDKIAAIQAAKAAGMQVCSGGIIGMGETMADRIDLALTLRNLDVHSVPINVLNPIPDTPLEDQTPLDPLEIRRTVAIFRLLLPKSAIRLAGGRGLMPDQGKSCFLSGANAAISGDMLTTSGISIENDMKIIDECGFTPKLLNL